MLTLLTLFHPLRKNPVISANFLVWKFSVLKGTVFARNYAENVFPQKFHTRKLGKITAFYVVRGVPK